MPPKGDWTDLDASFGARFLGEWKRLGGSLSNWNYATIQELRVCDREGMVAALRRHYPLTPHAAFQRIRNVESPEALARELSAQAIAANQASLWAANQMSVWMFLAALHL